MLYRAASKNTNLLHHVNDMIAAKLMTLDTETRKRFLQYIADYTFRYDNILRQWLRGKRIPRQDIDRHLKWAKWGKPNPESSRFGDECMHQQLYCFDQEQGCDNDKFGTHIFGKYLNTYMKGMVSAFNKIAVPCPDSILYRGLARGTGLPLTGSWTIAIDEETFSVLTNTRQDAYIFIKNIDNKGDKLQQMTVGGIPGVLVNCALDLSEVPGFQNLSISSSSSQSVSEEFAKSSVLLRIHADESCKVICMQVCTYFPNEDELLLFSNGALIPFSCASVGDIVFIDCRWRNEGNIQIPPWPVTSLFESDVKKDTELELPEAFKEQQIVTQVYTHPPPDMDFDQEWDD